MSIPDVYEVGNVLGLSREQVITAFDSLIASGIIFTPAKNGKDFFATRPPIRTAIQGPAMGKPKSVVSLGPFAISRKFYENVFLSLSKIMDEDAIHVLLNFKRLEYEKLGVVQNDEASSSAYHIAAPEETMIDFLRLSSLWDVMNPRVYEKFVWILPNDDCRKYAEEVTGEVFAPNDYRWWDTYINFGDDFEPMNADDVPERFSQIPNALMEGWAKYLPTWIYNALLVVYSKAFQLDNPNGSISLEKLEQIFEENLNTWETQPNPFEADRGLLIKEICDFNNLHYPYNVEVAIAFISNLGFVVRTDALEATMVLDIKLPENVLSLPDEWRERYDIFIRTGSILFAYLTTEEIMA
jgi:hypothetical protein